MSLQVTVRPAERTFEVARDEPILAAAIRAGIGLPYGCKDGACGSCKSRLLEGRVIHGAHQHKALSVAEEEGGLILPCCATPQTDCVIEARMVPGAGEFPVLKMPCRVISIERWPDLADQARRNLARQGLGNAEVLAGDGSRGLPEGAPYDAILVSAAFPQVPAPLAAQLRTGGRLVQPIGPGGSEQVVLFERSASGLERRHLLTLARFVRLHGRYGFPSRP